MKYIIESKSNGYTLRSEYEDWDDEARKYITKTDIDCVFEADKEDEHENGSALVGVFRTIIDSEGINDKYSRDNIEIKFPVSGRGVEDESGEEEYINVDDGFPSPSDSQTTTGVCSVCKKFMSKDNIHNHLKLDSLRKLVLEKVPDAELCGNESSGFFVQSKCSHTATDTFKTEHEAWEAVLSYIKLKDAK